MGLIIYPNRCFGLRALVRKPLCSFSGKCFSQSIPSFVSARIVFAISFISLLFIGFSCWLLSVLPLPPPCRAPRSVSVTGAPARDQIANERSHTKGNADGLGVQAEIAKSPFHDRTSCWRVCFWAPRWPANGSSGVSKRHGGLPGVTSIPSVASSDRNGVPPISINAPLRRPDIDLCRVKHLTQRP